MPVPVLSEFAFVFYNNIRHSLNKMAIIFNALATDISFINLKTVVCYKKLSSLEFNFHYQYSRHRAFFFFFFHITASHTIEN